MLLALLLTLCAWAGVVLEPLHDSGAGFFDAEFLPLPDGRTAIAFHPGTTPRGALVLLPDEAAWTTVPAPGVVLIAAPDGLRALTPWPDPILGGRSWRLEGERFIALDPLPEPPQSYGVQAARVGADGQVEAWVSAQGALAHLTTQGERWTSESLGNTVAWDDEGAVYLQDVSHVQGRRRWRIPKVVEGSQLSFDESPGGAPLFVAVEEGRVRVWYGGEAHTEPTPASRTIDATACTTSPCEQVEVIQAVPWSGRLAFDGEDPVIPIVRDTRVSSLTCRPMPMHPCDPAGPINTCPTEPSYDCSGPVEQTHELLLLRRRGGAWSAEPVPLEVDPLRVLDARVEGGEVQVLLETGVPAQARSLSLLRLGAEGEPRQVRTPGSAAAQPLSLDAMVTAGFVPNEGSSTYMPAPAWEEGALRTGGEALGVGWVDLTLPASEAGVRMEVHAEVEAWPQACGTPELLVRDRRGLERLLLSGEALILESDGKQAPIEAPAHGVHAWALSLDAEAVVVEVDGEEVHRRARPTAAPGPLYLSFGQRTTCGSPVGPEALWTGVSVGPISAE